MTITLVVPIYNEEPFLRRCLGSIVNQTVQFDEVILVDDCSTDKSGEIAREYACENGWRLIVNLENYGLSYSRNCGFMETALDGYIAFLDADDEFVLGACEKMHRAIEKYPHEGFLQFNHLRHYAPINKTVRKYDNRAGVFGIKNIHDCQCWWSSWNKVIKRKALKFYYREELGKFGEDGVFMLEHLLQGARIRTIDADTVIHHFENKHSLTKIKGKKELALLDRVQREILAEHCGVDEPFENIAAIFKCIEASYNNTNYKAIREGRE